MAAIEHVPAQEHGLLRWADREESRERFDGLARELAGESRDEFNARWEAGHYRDAADTADHRRIVRLAMLVPFGRT